MTTKDYQRAAEELRAHNAWAQSLPSLIMSYRWNNYAMRWFLVKPRQRYVLRKNTVGTVITGPLRTSDMSWLRFFETLTTTKTN